VAETVARLVQRHLGLLPVVDKQRQLVGALVLHDLLRLALPAFI
jgi:CBS-domain-containing membrane protein